VKRLVLGPILAVLATVAACANSASLGAPSEVSPEAGSPIFTTPPSEADASTSPTPQALLCIQTECIAPYATCPTSKWACDTNIDSDVKNCGGCGNACPANPNSGSLNMRFSCIDGKCVGACQTQIDFGDVRRTADCNGIIDDGCEVYLGTKQNCAACGDACPGDLECLNFQCACRAPLVPSGDECVCPPGTATCTTPWGATQCADLAASDQHCGACGRSCPWSPVPGRPNMYHGCVGSTCDSPKCTSGYADCDGDEENGCESLLNSDPKNCGVCGNACAPGKTCFRGECVCDEGTFCTNTCVDLATDWQNCGRCGYECPGLTASDAAFWSLPPPNGAPTCAGGKCDYTCEAGWADCDEDIENGCEANIMTNPLRCGGCNVRCAPGQVCSQGKCAMRECTGEEVQ